MPTQHSAADGCEWCEQECARLKIQLQEKTGELLRLKQLTAASTDPAVREEMELRGHNTSWYLDELKKLRTEAQQQQKLIGKLQAGRVAADGAADGGGVAAASNNNVGTRLHVHLCQSLDCCTLFCLNFVLFWICTVSALR